MNEQLVKTEIQERKVVYHLVTEQELKDFERTSLFGNLSAIITSISLGLAISLYTSNLINSELGRRASGYYTVFFYSLLVGLIFLFLTILLIVKNQRFSKKVIASSLVKQKKIAEEQPERSLQIIKAIYGSGMPQHELDITEKLAKEVINNKLQVVVSNELAGADPHHGIIKQLEVKFKSDDLEVTKTAKEGEVLKLP